MQVGRTSESATASTAGATPTSERKSVDQTSLRRSGTQLRRQFAGRLRNALGRMQK